MNFTWWQWAAFVIVDLLIKILLVAYVVLAISLGLVPVGIFVVDAVGLSLLHFMCLFLGATVVLSLELIQLRPSPTLRALVVIVVAEQLFFACIKAFLWFDNGSSNGDFNVSFGLIVAIVLTTANLVSLSIVFVLKWVISVLRGIGGRHRPGDCC